jgi:hypothetical protein
MKDWLGCVWRHQPDVLSNSQNMLAMDAFRGHLTNKIRSRLRNRNTDLLIVHSGMGNQLQPFDMSINKPFKHLVCKHYDAWLNKDSLERMHPVVLIEFIILVTIKTRRLFLYNLFY